MCIRDRLSAVEAPEGIGDLQTAVATAEQAYRDAREREGVTAAAADQADQAVQNGPRRAWLEETLRWCDEAAAVRSRQAEVDARAQRSSAVRRDATAAAAEAEQRLDRRRIDHQQATTRRDSAAAALATLQQRMALLGEVRMPAHLIELGLSLIHI